MGTRELRPVGLGCVRMVQLEARPSEPRGRTGLLGKTGASEGF